MESWYKWPYRGFVKGDGKGAKEYFKEVPDEGLRSLNSAREFDFFGGILRHDVALIDVDDQHQSKIIYQIIQDLDIKCNAIKTDRGMHFLFRDSNRRITQNSTGKPTALSVMADFKSGKRNVYHCLKKSGHEREFVRTTDDPDEIPIWLKPVMKAPSFFTMKEGDGRDSAMFSYILTLTKNGFSKEDVKETLDLINRYVLSDPLTDEEMRRITRDDAFPDEVFFEGQKFLHHKFADWLINEYSIKRVNGQLGIFVDGVYRLGTKAIEEVMIKHIPSIRQRQRKETMLTMDLRDLPRTKSLQKNYIAFRNGILNVSSGIIVPNNSEYTVINRIPWDYNENANSGIVDRVLDNISCHDPEIRANLEECVGYCLCSRNELSKMFMFTGEGANGKSTFLSMIKFSLGDENCSSLDIDELGERFSVASLQGKLANIGDDIPTNALDSRSVARLKKIVSGNSIKAEFKGQDSFEFEPTAKLIFSINGIPRFNSANTKALMRRLITIPFNASFSEKDEDYDPFLIEKLENQEAAEYLIKLGVQGLQRILKRGFTKSDAVSTENRQVEIANNPILHFIEDTGLTASEVIGFSVSEVYARYAEFCAEEGLKPLGRSEFSRRICKAFCLNTAQRRSEGKRVRIYV